jgi:hypothetical protein
MDRNTLYIRLWLIWMAILAIGFAYMLFSVGAFGWPYTGIETP